MLAFVRYLRAVTPSLKLGAGVVGGYGFWSGLDEGNPFTLDAGAPTEAFAMPSLGGQPRAELLLAAGLFLALTPEFLWSKITSSSGDAIADVVPSISRFDVAASVGYAF